jgi:hypothetical protein
MRKIVAVLSDCDFETCPSVVAVDLFLAEPGSEESGFRPFFGAVDGNPDVRLSNMHHPGKQAVRSLSARPPFFRRRSQP